MMSLRLFAITSLSAAAFACTHTPVVSDCPDLPPAAAADESCLKRQDVDRYRQVLVTKLAEAIINHHNVGETFARWEAQGRSGRPPLEEIEGTLLVSVSFGSLSKPVVACVSEATGGIATSANTVTGKALQAFSRLPEGPQCLAEHSVDVAYKSWGQP
jgi:hypothetical protein